MVYNLLFILSVIIFSFSAVIISTEDLPLGNAQEIQTQCINYDDSDSTITINCKHPVTPTDLYNSLSNMSENIFIQEDEKIWGLNSNVVVENDATLVIDSSDTDWLKIYGIQGEGEEGDNTGNEPFHISILGSLIIDSVKVSSWDQNENDHIKYEVEIRQGPTDQEETPYDKVPRPYIRVQDESTGTTRISNSEIAYLGYDCKGGCSGLSYYGGMGHLIEKNEIHHNRFGYYSNGVTNTTIENNHIHHNYMYGLDPHTGTNDMIIRNNTIHDHGAMGIICSLDCYNILIEDNEVYNSTGSGIMFSKNMTDSTARNNYVHDETQCIFVSQSRDNLIYDNIVENCNNGIYLKNKSSDNHVYNNTIINTENSGIQVNTNATNNIFEENIIDNAPEGNEIDIETDDLQSQNTFLDNLIIDSIND
jgi:mannuronan 5-epimerase